MGNTFKDGAHMPDGGRKKARPVGPEFDGLNPEGSALAHRRHSLNGAEISNCGGAMQGLAAGMSALTQADIKPIG
jgi:hypothetical protein